MHLQSHSLRLCAASMGKLQTLKPAIPMAQLGRIKAITAETQRVTGRKLQVANARILARDPLCVKCLEQCRVSASVEVDHIVPLHLGGSDDDSNKQGLCIPCHQAKSADEARGRAGQKSGAF